MSRLVIDEDHYAHGVYKLDAGSHSSPKPTHTCLDQCRGKAVITISSGPVNTIVMRPSCDAYCTELVAALGFEI